MHGSNRKRALKSQGPPSGGPSRSPGVLVRWGQSLLRLGGGQRDVGPDLGFLLFLLRLGLSRVAGSLSLVLGVPGINLDLQNQGFLLRDVIRKNPKGIGLDEREPRKKPY